jgi:hypothetical protein
VTALTKRRVIFGFWVAVFYVFFLVWVSTKALSGYMTPAPIGGGSVVDKVIVFVLLFPGELLFFVLSASGASFNLLHLLGVIILNAVIWGAAASFIFVRTATDD